MMSSSAPGFSPAVVTWLVEHCCKTNELEHVQLLQEAFRDISQDDGTRIPHYEHANHHMTLKIVQTQFPLLQRKLEDCLANHQHDAVDMGRWQALLDAVDDLEQWSHRSAYANEKDVFDRIRATVVLYAVAIEEASLLNVQPLFQRVFPQCPPTVPDCGTVKFYVDMNKAFGEGVKLPFLHRLVTITMKRINYSTLSDDVDALCDAVAASLPDTIIERLERFGIKANASDSPSNALRVLDDASLGLETLKALCGSLSLDFAKVYHGDTDAIRAFQEEEQRGGAVDAAPAVSTPAHTADTNGRPLSTGARPKRQRLAEDATIGTSTAPVMRNRELLSDNDLCSPSRSARGPPEMAERPHALAVVSPAARRHLRQKEMEKALMGSLQADPKVKRSRIQTASDVSWSSDGEQENDDDLFDPPKPSRKKKLKVKVMNGSRPSRRGQAEEEDAIESDTSDWVQKAPPVGRKRKRRAISGKRVRKRWTDAEVESLMEGLRLYGVGKWKVIHEKYDFGDRTPVDLKDKYRNLLKHFSEEQLLSGK